MILVTLLLALLTALVRPASGAEVSLELIASTAPAAVPDITILAPRPAAATAATATATSPGQEGPGKAVHTARGAR